MVDLVIFVGINLQISIILVLRCCSGIFKRQVGFARAFGVREDRVSAEIV